MKKVLLILGITAFAACTNGKLCPYTSNIVDFSSKVAQDGVQAATIEQKIQNAIKNNQLDSVAIYTGEAATLASATIQDKDSLTYYIDKCKDKGYDSTSADTVK